MGTVAEILRDQNQFFVNNLADTYLLLTNIELKVWECFIPGHGIFFMGVDRPNFGRGEGGKGVGNAKNFKDLPERF